MINFFTRKKRYKTFDINYFYYSNPTIDISNHFRKSTNINNLVVGKSDNLIKINDGGLFPIFNESDINEIVNCEYGYCVIDCHGALSFSNTILNCLEKFEQEENKMISIKNIISDLNGCGEQLENSFKLERLPLRLGITTVSDVDSLILEFLQRGSFPIYINNDDNLLCDNSYNYGYKKTGSGSILENLCYLDSISMPSISYGAFYLNSKNKILASCSQSLLRCKKLEVRVADITKVNSSTVQLYGMNFYKDDIIHYPDYNTFLTKNRVRKRDKKLQMILNES